MLFCALSLSILEKKKTKDQIEILISSWCLKRNDLWTERTMNVDSPRSKCPVDDESEKMWMWWLTPTCSTLLYWQRERRGERKGEKEIERENYERVTWICVYVCVQFLLSLSSTWMVGSVLCRVFFSQTKKKKKKKNEKEEEEKTARLHKFFSSSRLMNSELLTLSFARTSSLLWILLITQPTNEKNNIAKKNDDDDDENKRKKNGRSLRIMGLASSLLL